VLKEKEATEDASIETVPSANVEKAIDVEIVRIMKEKQSISDASDDARAVRDGASDDANDRERVEV
jgi:hypothetical protein